MKNKDDSYQGDDDGGGKPWDSEETMKFEWTSFPIDRTQIQEKEESNMALQIGGSVTGRRRFYLLKRKGNGRNLTHVCVLGTANQCSAVS